METTDGLHLSGEGGGDGGKWLDSGHIVEVNRLDLLRHWK